MQILERLGWMLFHSLWQILVIACTYGVVLSAFRLRSAQARYALACMALVLMVLVPAATLVYVIPARDAVVTGSVRGGISPVQSSKANSLTDAAFVHESFPERRENETLHSQTISRNDPAPADDARGSRTIAVQPALPVAALLWLIGIMVLSFRPVLGLSHVIRLRRRGLLPVSAELQALVENTSRRLGLVRPVEVAQSPSITVPLVIGILRPLLIFSPNALACLTPRQLEGVIAHELAHIRRNDILVNFLQSLVEVLLFYHPAMWWVSRRIREERENCCDDLAVRFISDRTSYLEMLLGLEQSCRIPQLASAASGGALLKRVRRIAAPEGSPSHVQSSALLGGIIMVVLSCLLAIWLAAANGVLNAADAVPDNPVQSAKASTAQDAKPEDAKEDSGANNSKMNPQVAQEQQYDEQGFTALHRAAIGGEVEEVASLIDDGADVNVPQATFQGTPLQYAAAGGKTEVVELLLSSGASIDSIDSAGRTPLMWAADQGRTEIVKLLLKNKADVNAETKTGWTAFRYAVQSGQTDMVKLFKGKVSFDQLDKEGFALLHRMASGGHAKSVQVLIDAGADVNVRQKTYQGTPLQYAANQGHAEVVKILLKGEATIDAQDSFGRTPLMWAAMSGKKDVAEALISSDANVNAKTESGWTALRYARQEGHADVAELLLKHGAKDEAPSEPRTEKDESRD
jgi:ankyrin repeat protein/beta-lactamase regulating signal transducer with metallopeptidase domain